MKIKFGKETLISGGLVILGVAQLLLANKKDTVELESLKGEVVKDVMEKIAESKN